MKTRIIIFFTCAIVALGLAGCKPKPVSLSGQIFIVTQGRENIKLGDVEISLVEKSQVTDFLTRKLPIIERYMTSNHLAFELAETNYQIAKANYDSFEANKPDRYQQDYLAFLSNKVFDSYLNFDQVKRDIIKLKGDSERLSQYSAYFQSASSLAENNEDYTASANDLQQSTDDSGQALDLSEQADSKLDELQQFVSSKESDYSTAMSGAEEADLNAETTLVNYPSADNYFFDFFPIPFQTTRSDADGKFSFLYIKGKELVIYAKAERSVPNGTETYYWLVDTPTNSETPQIFLSNDNLANNDPSGYFEIKPKEQPGTQ